MPQPSKLHQRLSAGPVLCAEGYVFELERRGYIKAGAYVPEVVADHPEVVSRLHAEFQRAGSDVVVALTYYAHRDKLKAVGREQELESMNRTALKLARTAARDTNALLAGNICNTWTYDLDDKEASGEAVRAQYREQVGWAAEAGADFILAETIEYLGEALIALEVIKEFNLPAVINFSPIYSRSKDDVDWVKACRVLKDNGADVVGFNCARGPATILPMVERLRDAVDGPIAAVPVPYRTTPDQPAFQFLKDPGQSGSYPVNLDPFVCSRAEMADFTAAARDLGVSFIGICCGAGPHHVRAMAEALGRTTPASRYSPDMSLHGLLGSDQVVRASERQFLDKWQDGART